jgi:hypothetical protein
MQAAAIPTTTRLQSLTLPVVKPTTSCQQQQPQQQHPTTFKPVTGTSMAVAAVEEQEEGTTTATTTRPRNSNIKVAEKAVGVEKAAALSVGGACFRRLSLTFPLHRLWTGFQRAEK